MYWPKQPVPVPVPPPEPTMPPPSPAPILKLSLPACASPLMVTLLGASLLGFGESVGFCGMSCGLCIGFFCSSTFFGSGGFSFGGGGGGGKGVMVAMRGASRRTPTLLPAKCQTSRPSSTSTTTPTAGPSQRRGDPRREVGKVTRSSLRRLAGDQADLRQVHATQQVQD